MNPQLQTIIDEFDAAQERMMALARDAPGDVWERRPDPAGVRWSAAECVDHLNRTSEAFLPILVDGLDRARGLPASGSRRHRHDLVGWLLWRTMGPPVRFKVGTAAPFVPDSLPARDVLLNTFERLQGEQSDLVRAGDGLPLSQVRVASAFNPRVRYNLYSCMSILPRHQHRHLWQAEQAVRSIR